MFDYNVLICFGALRSLSTANAIWESKCHMGKVNYTDPSTAIALTNQCKPESKRVDPRLASILLTPLTKPNCPWTSLRKVDYQYFVHTLFTTQSMIRYCRITYTSLHPYIYLQCQNCYQKQAECITRDIRH